MGTIKAVIFDHSTIFPLTLDQQIIDGVRNLLETLKQTGIKIAVFSNNNFDIDAKLQSKNLPPIDLFLTEQKTGKKKGSPVWIEKTMTELGVNNYQMMYIGDEKHEWLTAINSRTIYAHAGWCNLLQYGPAFVAEQPSEVWRFITHYLLPPARCEYSLDRPEYRLCLRSLLAASATFDATTPARFTLQDVLTYDNPVTVGNFPARNLLIVHGITSLYLEGLIGRNALFTVYPSSTPGKRNPILEEFVRPVSKLFHGYFEEDLIIRAAQAPDTSMVRAAARKKGQTASVPISIQTNTVHLNPQLETKIRNRPVIVIDDFTTSGKSLEWARNLLIAAGASDIVLLTVGKYRGPHEIYIPRTLGLIKPFELTQYDAANLFRIESVQMDQHQAAQSLVQASFRYLKNNEPLPPSAYQI